MTPTLHLSVTDELKRRVSLTMTHKIKRSNFVAMFSNAMMPVALPIMPNDNVMSMTNNKYYIFLMNQIDLFTVLPESSMNFTVTDNYYLPFQQREQINSDHRLRGLLDVSF